MKSHNRRKHFLINKPFQFRYIFYVVATLTIISAAGITGTYYGIWASVLKAFSEETLQSTLDTAAQIYDYDQARRPAKIAIVTPSIRTFRETELLSVRQKEMIQRILDDTHYRLIGLGAILFVFIGWGSIFLTHKIAGPLFRFNRCFKTLEEGDLRARANLRKLDEAKDVAENFNAMADSFEKRIIALKQLTNEKSPAAAVEAIKKELAHFKTASEEN
jgi:methyl-accepting chemotaxis protein